MRLGIPAVNALLLSNPYRAQVYVLPQRVQLGEQRTYLSTSDADQSPFDGATPAVYRAVSVKEILSLRQRNNRSEAVAMIYPSHHFHTMPLQNQIDAALCEEDALYFYPLRCSGSPFTFLVQGLLYLHRKRKFSVPQIKLLVNSLDNNIKTFVVCPRTAAFEPSLNEITRYTSALFDRNSAYEAKVSGWQRCSHRSIGQALSAMVSGRVLVWVDWFGSARHASTIVEKLEKWGLQREHIVENQIYSRSTQFPHQFAVVTVTPARDKIEALGNQVVQWTSTGSAENTGTG